MLTAVSEICNKDDILEVCVLLQSFMNSTHELLS